jgi:ABC-2 type transport system permease protein
MNAYQTWTSFYTITRKETLRIFRIWIQTFMPSVINSLLYFTIFGTVLGSRIGEIQGVPYIQFVVPGLVMLAVVTNALMNVSSSFYAAKFMGRNIDELLVSPTPAWVIVAGYISGGVMRGVVVGVLVMAVSLVYAVPPVTHPFIIALFLLLSAFLFSALGLVNGIYGKSFDSISLIPTFAITPLVYLGGVFYSVHSLPAWLQTITYANPIFYLINGFRYGFLGISDVSIYLCVGILLALTIFFTALCAYLIHIGLGLKQ